MSLKTMLWAMDQRNLSPVEKIVLLDLAERTGESGCCWPTVGTIAERCNITSRTTTTTLHNLRSYGLIAIQQSEGRRANTYHLQTDRQFNPAKISDEICEDEIGTENHEPGSGPTLQSEQPTMKMAAFTPYIEPPKITSLETSLDNHARGRANDPIPDEDVMFYGWWGLYPRRENIVDAKAAWKWAIRQISPDAIIRATIAFKFPTEPEFIPQPANWLRKRRWQDERPGNGIDPVLAAAGLSRSDFDHGAPR